MSNADVIAAVATPSGRGGIGIVRVSGCDLGVFAQAITGVVPEARVATRAEFLAADGSVIDSGIALYFRSPASYTGEDVLELQGHGGPVILQMLMRRCLELGARIAEPGEFTRRAFLNDKLDLAQAEAVADIIEAASVGAARCALRSLKGEFSNEVNVIGNDLLMLRTWVEATLDFPEEDIDATDRGEISARLHALKEAVSRTLSKSEQGSILRAGLNVVLVGRPNVGKSSLLNRFAREDVAIVTPIPGTTRDALRQTIQVRGIPVNIIDTAGLREASDEVEAIGIQRTWDSIGKADLVILVVDASVGITASDEAILAEFPPGLSRMTVFNKIDLVPIGSEVAAKGSDPALFVSAKSGAGLDELQLAVERASGWQASGEDVFVGRERHIVALKEAFRALTLASGLLDCPELLAEELRRAHHSVGAITGEVSADDLLGEIFSSFCIGK